MKHAVYTTELLSIFGNVPENKRAEFITRFSGQARNPTIVFGCSVFLGYFGVDRFLLGQALLGIIKLLTAGGLGIWAVIDLFLVGGTARQKNIDLARQIQSTL
jgi:TM2 domain-containing membrane protein YozV